MPKPKLDERHDALLRFLTHRGQSWDTAELSAELGFPRHTINRLGRELASYDKLNLVAGERRGTYSMRARKNT